MSATINLVVALPCEAKPLVAHFQLKKDYQSTVFPVYRSLQRPIHLVVSGVSRVAAATAVGFLHAYLQLDHTSSYLNIGIAGARHLSCGDSVIASKIMSSTQSRAFYPSISLLTQQRCSPLLTLDQPAEDYPLEKAVDMEGFGFFQAAQLFVDHDRIHCFKVISDTSGDEQLALNASRVSELIQSQMMAIESLVNQVEVLQNLVLPPKINSQDFLSRWHFTVSQALELQQILRRWQAWHPLRNAFDFCALARGAGEVIKMLEAQLLG